MFVYIASMAIWLLYINSMKVMFLNIKSLHQGVICENKETTSHLLKLIKFKLRYGMICKPIADPIN